MKKRILIQLILLLTIVGYADAQKQTPNEYINKYKELAIIEMHRSGVPASITLAQGILESNSGNSRLAKFANNHFGIKCKSSWTGNVIYANDDAPDECFRAYESVLDSYQDHSDFLRKNWRYHPLFELDQLDYKGWCNGLRKAGYATNPQYGKILISLIEKYELNQYDGAKLPGTELPKLVQSETLNGIPVKTVKEGETVSTIATDNYVKDKHIRKWNDLSESDKLTAGDVVYLKPKRRRGSQEKHVVTKGEDMRSISQQYGIKLKHLYRKNRMESGSEPKEGEVLYMQKKRETEDAVELADREPQWKDEPEAFINPHSVPKKVIEKTDFNNPGAIDKKEIEVPEYHTVAKGDNIYRIAEKYHVFEEDILKWNKNLNPMKMNIGQKIYLSSKQQDAVSKPTKTVREESTNHSDEEIDRISKDITVSGPVTHIVVKGDTLYRICKRYNVTEEQLKKWNDLSTITIHLGQKLKVSE